VSSVLVIGLLVLTFALAWRDSLAKFALAALGIVGAVSPFWVFTSAGFIVDGTAAFIALCGVACVVIAVVAVRRIGAEPSTSTPVTP
jgi:hypothetical protein